jgi:hypothetical protein
VVNVLIGPRVHHGLTAHDHEQLLKLFGYARGGGGVDSLLDYLNLDSPFGCWWRV